MYASKELILVLFSGLLLYFVVDVTSDTGNQPTCVFNPSSIFLKASKRNEGACSIKSNEEDSENIPLKGTLVIHLGNYEKREALFVLERQKRKPSRLLYSGNLLKDDISLDLDLSQANGNGPGFVIRGHTVINDEKRRVEIKRAERQFRMCHGESCLTAEYETEEAPLHFEVPSTGQVKSSAVQNLFKVVLDGQQFFGEAEWRDICKHFSEEETACSGQLSAIIQNISWNLERESESLTDSYKLQFALNRGRTFFANGQFSSTTNLNETRTELIFTIPDFVDLRVNITSINSTWKVHVVGSYPRLDYRVESSSEFAATETGVSLSHRTMISNSSSLVATYRLGLSKSGPDLDVRHNLTSDYYEIESNMTVTQLADNLTMTLITQRAASPIWEFLNFTLKQVFFSRGDLNWETVVMRSTITNMHVTGRWIDSILSFYDKTFQFISNDESFFPSLNIKLDFSGFSRFKAVFHFPLLARKLEALLTLDKSQLFPVEFTLNDLDEFEPTETNLIDFEMTKRLNDYQAFCDINVDRIEDLFVPLVGKLLKVLSPVNSTRAGIYSIMQIPEMQLFKDVWNLVLLGKTLMLEDLTH